MTPVAVPHERPGVVLALVFLGGALGAVAREFLAPALPDPWFWFPILLVNVLASFLMGWLFMLRGRWHPYWTHTLVGGFCGGFSTFSHFSYELVTLADAARYLEAGGYIALAVVFGIAAAVAGEWFGGRLHGAR
ncbi:MAG: CrcB family protein [Xanthomonadales bacterium]|nr:CrcB family protein [Xanthomonadales bacterium]